MKKRRLKSVARTPVKKRLLKPAVHIPLPKVPTGITGFDEITYGGLPLGRTTLVRGGPGCGKTVFAMQTMVNGARDRHEPGILVAFEENASQIVANAATLGWDIPALAAKRLFFLDASLSPEMMQNGEFDLSRLLNLLQAVATEGGVKRIVFDGVDVLLRLLDNPVAERREIYRIRDWLSRNGLSAIITQKVGADDDLSRQHYNFMQFMADCVINLGHQVVAGSGFRNIRVMKYRGSGFLGDEFPITITQAGIQVTNRGPIELQYFVTNERVSSGLPRLDAMLHGGYYRGSNILISGAPGTAKSTLGGLFAAAACERGERALYVNFDEGATQIVRNLSSVGIRLAPHQKSGLLKIYSTRTRGPNIEDQFGELRAVIRAHQPKCLIIDPLSALSSKLAHIASADATQMFLDYLKVEGITVVNTSLLDGPDIGEATATGISTIADTWIHVSYLIHEGERNRALTIVKSRGSGHSNQVRELTLSNSGVALTDVFTAQGQVLMGVARWEREQEELANKKRALGVSAFARLKLKLAQAEAATRLQVIKTEMEARNAEIALLNVELTSASELLASDRLKLRKLRHADEELPLPKRNGKKQTPPQARKPGTKTAARSPQKPRPH
jgi:circadian clock protein KaiC